MHPHIEAYLAEVGQQLKNLSEAKHREEIDELKQHLLALVKEGQDKGLSEEASVVAALRQFGPPERVGRDLNNGVRRRRAMRLLPPGIRVVIAQTLILFIPNFALAFYSYFWSEIQSKRAVDGWLYIGFVLSDIPLAVLSFAMVYGLLQFRPWAWRLGVAVFGFQTFKSFAMNGLVLHSVLNDSGPLNRPMMLREAILQVTPLLCLVLLFLNRDDYFKLVRAKSRAA